MIISCFSFTEMARRAAALMPNGGSLLTLTYGGSVRVMPNYNVMGVAKAALESSVRYLAADYGPQGNSGSMRFPPVRCARWPAPASAMRVPCSTSRSAIRRLRRTVTLDEVGGAALYLLSPLSGGVTGEIHYVDSGYNIISTPRPEDLKRAFEEGDD